MLATGKPRGVSDRDWGAFVGWYRGRERQRDIAARLGVSSSRVHQIVWRTEVRCRRRMGGWGWGY
jgi:DNA-directed RNA polymerase specialized sigma24 family protein